MAESCPASRATVGTGVGATVGVGVGTGVGVGSGVGVTVGAAVNVGATVGVGDGAFCTSTVANGVDWNSVYGGVDVFGLGAEASRGVDVVLDIPHAGSNSSTKTMSSGMSR